MTGNRHDYIITPEGPVFPGPNSAFFTWLMLAASMGLIVWCLL